MSNNVGRVRVDESTGQQVESEMLAVGNHGVPGVCASVEATNNVVTIEKQHTNVNMEEVSQPRSTATARASEEGRGTSAVARQE